MTVTTRRAWNGLGDIASDSESSSMPIKSSAEERLFDIQESHSEVEIEKFSIQIEHVYLVSVVSPKYSVSSVKAVGF